MNKRLLFLVMVVTALMLAACGGAAATPTPGTAVQPTADTTEMMTDTDTMTDTEMMTDTDAMTDTEMMTDTDAMTDTMSMGEIETVCLVTDLGNVNDGTFNEYAYQGMVQAVDEFSLESTYIETQSETDYAKNIDTCVQEGYDAIITVGFLIADATLAAAEEHPDIMFIGVDQFFQGQPDNLVGIQFREDQGGFMVGALACMMTESNTVAGVYGI